MKSSTFPLLGTLHYSSEPIRALADDFGMTPDEADQAKALMDAGLPPLTRPEVLSFLFGVSYRLILSMCQNNSLHYRVFEQTKRSGGVRQVEAPRRYLKLIQRWIHTHILSKRELPSCVQGFVTGRSIFSNAELHLKSKNVLVVDIKSFFPSITDRKVRRVFRSFGFPIRVSNRLTSLCTFEHRLPQGAPTSPMLANIIFAPTDKVLQELAREWDCIYSRYADDIVFSGDRYFHRSDIEKISSLLRKDGFEIHPDKSRILGSGRRQMVAGVVINEKGYPLRAKRKEWRATFHQVALNPSRYVGSSAKLRGIASFVRQYDAELSAQYVQIADKVFELEQNAS